MTVRRKLAIYYTLTAIVVTVLCLFALVLVADHCPERLHIAVICLCALAIVVFAIAGAELAYAATKKENGRGEAKDTDSIEQMFIGNVSHELRTPLATLIGSLDLALQRERTVAYYQETIAESLQNAWQMSRLIDGLLDLAKADYSKGQVKTERIRLDELLIDVRETILKQHPDYQIELLFGNEEADDDSSITVLGNAYLLRIAFSNLIENNCKYSANKTSFVQISFWDKWCTVFFSDNGRGMNEQEQEKLFDLFYRGEQSKDVEGSGIGMTLVQKIILLHQGEITVRSMKGEGTTFLIQFLHV